MSEQQLPKQTAPTNAQVMTFVAILSLVCALVLSILASALKEPQEIAKELDRSEQMLISAQIMNHMGNFLMLDDKGEHVPAKYAGKGVLVPGSKEDRASRQEILEVYKRRLRPFLVDGKGNVTTFAKAGIDEDDYVNKYKKSGYYRQPYKLMYEILPNPKKGESETKEGEKPIGYVIPVNGMGLWDAIYGYIAIEPDGDTIIGIAWYEQKETPGLGANIADAPWQSEFPGKKIFLESPDGKTDFKAAPVGITVVKGKVAEVLGETLKAKSAVDGMPGATLTGNGVTTAYRDVLSAYRPFFIKIHDESKKN